MVGKKLGQYEVVELIGSGGMGEVYRARDTELQRDVAIKVLPHALARDPQRLSSFRQEARTLAGIQHPNIAAVFGLDKTDGVQFFAQELIEGDTLDARLETEPPDLQETLGIAAQIAEGLEAAHAAGVVHRDLKPANIMITPEGTVKILDFGLATPAIEEDAPPPVADESTPTLSNLQPDNVIFGTPAYMSPDQARGRFVDERGDIWSFGCVLYEMLAGAKAFGGDEEAGDETLLDTLSDVVRGEPDWDALPADTPPRLVRLLRRCLRKKTRDRLQHMGDARIELEEMLAEPDLGVDAVGVAAPTTAGRQLPLTTVLLALVLVAVAAWWVGSRRTAPRTSIRPPLHASMTVPDEGRLVLDTVVTLAVSPDDSRVAYVARVDGIATLFLQSLTRRELTRLPAAEDTNNPFFSPDGEWIGFFVQNRHLMKMSADGGAAFEVCDVPSGNWGATWLPDDTIVFAPAFTGSGLRRVSADGGEPAALLELDSEVGEVAQSGPQALPGGDRVLFTSRRADSSVAAVLDLQTGTVHDVLAGAVDARYSDTGHLLFSRDGQLFAIAFDPETLETRGAPESLLRGLFVDPQSGEARFGLGDDLFIYVPGEAAPAGDRLVWVGRDGSVQPLDVEPGDYGHPRLSPDGSRVTMDRIMDGRGDIWVYDLQRRGLNRLTREGDNRMPVWEPSGLRVAYAANVGGTTGIYWKNADGSGERHRIIASEHSLWPRSWGAGAIAYYEINPETGRDIWALSNVDGDNAPTTPRPLVQTRANERAPALSPDGRWMAYVSDESGRDQVYVQAFRGSPARTLVSTDGGREPVWARDGTQLFYRSGRTMMSVPVELGERFVAGSPEPLFEGTFKADHMGSNQYFDVAPDGERFLMIQQGGGGGPDHLHLIAGFAQQLRRIADRN